MFRVLFFVSSSVVVTDLTSPIYHGFQGTQHLFSTFLSNVLFGIMTPLDTTSPTLSTVKILRVVLDTVWCSKSTSKVLRVPTEKISEIVVDFPILPH